MTRQNLYVSCYAARTINCTRSLNDHKIYFQKRFTHRAPRLRFFVGWTRKKNTIRRRATQTKSSTRKSRSLRTPASMRTQYNMYQRPVAKTDYIIILCANQKTVKPALTPGGGRMRTPRAFLAMSARILNVGKA